MMDQSTALAHAMGVATQRGAFFAAWDRLNGKRGYSVEQNCWVWVIGFKLLDEWKEQADGE